MFALRRRLLSMAVPALAALAAALVLTVVIGVLGVLLARGAGAVNFAFLTTGSREAGAEGGVVWQLVGTFVLIASALVVATPLALAWALTQEFYLTRHSRARRVMAGVLQMLNGVPSVVFGILGLVVFVGLLGWGKSWLSGGILLGVMIVPTLALALGQRISAIPPRFIEAAAGLGLGRGVIVRTVVLPQSFSGLVTGSLLGLSRAAGETAPILFAAAIFSGATWPTGIADSPVLALPYHIFVLAQDSLHPGAQANLWGAALVLVALALLLNLAALPLRLKAHDPSRTAH
ncbi:MAG: ABC transporter permease subunit [Candidatus Didemnitutus sp.]|nr:ABC transporter permease subunit [Candidatus Didemnitutus sp.]